MGVNLVASRQMIVSGSSCDLGIGVVIGNSRIGQATKLAAYACVPTSLRECATFALM